MSNEKSKTAEEILKPLIKNCKNDTCIFNTLDYIKYPDALSAMEQYASQQTKPLEDKIKQLEADNRSQVVCFKGIEWSLRNQIESLASQLAEKDKEITDLKLLVTKL